MQKKYIKELTENECIHTPTEEIYNQVSAKLNELRLKWGNGKDYLELRLYDRCVTNSVIYPKKGVYSSVSYANRKGYTIYTINDLKDFTMEKQIKLTSEQAKELYNLQPNLRNNLLSDFSDEELGIKPILKDWKDLDFKGSYYPNYGGDIRSDKAGLRDIHLNSPTKATVKMTFATAQLAMLLHDLPKGNWAIIRYDDQLEVRAIPLEDKTFYFLSFDSENLADAFLEKHERLIKDYYLLP